MISSRFFSENTVLLTTQTFTGSLFSLPNHNTNRNVHFRTTCKQLLSMAPGTAVDLHLQRQVPQPHLTKPNESRQPVRKIA